MSQEKTTAIDCPLCRQPAILAGNKITCEKCDAIYRITKEGEAKLDKLGPIEDLQKRVAALETGGQKPEPEPEETNNNESDESDEQADAENKDDW